MVQLCPLRAMGVLGPPLSSPARLAAILAALSAAIAAIPAAATSDRARTLRVLAGNAAAAAAAARVTGLVEAAAWIPGTRPQQHVYSTRQVRLEICWKERWLALKDPHLWLDTVRATPGVSTS